MIAHQPMWSASAEDSMNLRLGVHLETPDQGNNTKMMEATQADKGAWALRCLLMRSGEGVTLPLGRGWVTRTHTTSYPSPIYLYPNEWIIVQWIWIIQWVDNRPIGCNGISPDPKNKTPRSHYKILSKLTEIYWRWLSMICSYSVQSGVARPHVGPTSRAGP